MRFLTVSLGLCLLAASAHAMPVLMTPAAKPALPVIHINESTFGAAEDDTDFLFRLGMLEGHLMIGHKLLQNKQPSLALPHFGHPVRELYSDLESYLDKKKFPPFDKQLAQLEIAVTAAPDSPDTEAKYQAVIATLHRARELTPADLRASVPEMIKVCADTVDAASGEFGEALEHGQIHAVVEYHDSKGYLEYVHQQVDQLLAANPDASDKIMLNRFKSALAKAEWIVEPLLPSPAPRASVSQYRAVAAEGEDIARQPKPATTAAP